MLGWFFVVFRQRDGGASPASASAPEGKRVAAWQTGLDGPKWIDALVKQGRALNLGGNGYPYRYTATAKDLLPTIAAGPPEARAVWVAGPQDVLGEGWDGATAVDQSESADCHPDEWLLIEVWDES